MSFNKDTGLYEGYIYLMTNKVNGKVYVGQTTTTIEHRMGQHFSNDKRSTTHVVKNAIRKYGKDAFEVSELFRTDAKTKNELVSILNEKEKEYILQYHSLVSENGYNVDKGGSSVNYLGVAVDVYDLDKNFISTFDSINECARYYDVDSGIIIDMCKGYTNRSIKCDLIFRYKGEPFDKYDTSYISGGAKKVYQFELDGTFVREYECESDAEELVNGTRGGTGISTAIRWNKTAYGYYWSFNKEFNFDIENYRNYVPVDKYTTDGIFIESYKSVTDALFSVGMDYTHYSNIKSVCDGDTITAFGFVWRYKGEAFDSKRLTKKKYKKPVNQYTKDNKTYLATFDSAKDAMIELNFNSCSAITGCCRYKVPSFMGYKWYYANDPNQPDKSQIRECDYAFNVEVVS